MKTKVLTLVMTVLMTGLLLLGTSSAKAQMIPEKTLKSMVIQSIGYPEEAVERGIEGEVVVSFRQLPDGRMEVTGINSVSPVLKNYVYKTITELKVPLLTESASETVYLRFFFVLQ